MSEANLNIAVRSAGMEMAHKAAMAAADDLAAAIKSGEDLPVLHLVRAYAAARLISQLIEQLGVTSLPKGGAE